METVERSDTLVSHNERGLRRSICWTACILCVIFTLMLIFFLFAKSSGNSLVAIDHGGVIAPIADDITETYASTTASDALIVAAANRGRIERR